MLSVQKTPENSSQDYSDNTTQLPVLFPFFFGRPALSNTRAPDDIKSKNKNLSFLSPLQEIRRYFSINSRYSNRVIVYD